MAGISLADVYARLVLDDKEAKKQLAGMGNSPQAQAAGAGLGKKLGTGLARGFTAAGASSGVLLAGAVESAGSFEQQLATIKTVAQDLSDVELAKIGDDIQALARETGRSTDELTAGFYDLVSAGVPAEEAISVLRDSAKLATGALGTTTDTVDLVTSALNAYGLEASESTRVTDIFAKAVADGKVTAAEIGSSLANIAPLAASAGVSLEEVSAGYALLTAKGVPAAQAATQMRAAISALLTPNETLNKLQKETGKNFADLVKAKGLAGALEELREATGGNAEQFAKALGSVEAYQFALNTTGENAQAMQDQIAETGDVAGLAAKQYEIASDTTEGRAKRLAQTFATTFQDIGSAALPLGNVLLAVNQLGPALGGLISPAKLIGGALGGLGPKLIAGLGALVPGMAAGLAGVGSAIGGLIAAAIPIGMALLPALLVAAIVAAIVFLANNPEIVDQIIAFGEQAVQFIVDGLSGLVTALPEIFETAFNAVLAAIPGFVGAVVNIVSQIPGLLLDLVPKVLGLFVRIHVRVLQLFLDLAAKVVGFVLSIPGRIAPMVGQLLGHFARVAAGAIAKAGALAGKVASLILSIPGRVAGWVGSLLGQAGRIASGVAAKVTAMAGQVVAMILSIPGKAIAWISNLISGAARAGQGFLARVVSFAGQVVRTILGIPGKIIPGIVNGFANAAKKAAQAFLDGIAGLPGAVGDAVGGVGNFLGGLVPKFATGAYEIPQDMLAMVHQGEMIVPKEYADPIREGTRTLTSMTPASLAPGSGAGGGVTVNVPVQGALPVRTPTDLIEGLRGIAEAGVLPSLLDTPKYRWNESNVGVSG